MTGAKELMCSGLYYYHLVIESAGTQKKKKRIRSFATNHVQRHHGTIKDNSTYPGLGLGKDGSRIRSSGKIMKPISTSFTMWGQIITLIL